MSNHVDPNVAIDLLGGTSRAARFFEVKMASVSGWRRSRIPRARLMYLRVVRPDIYQAALKDPSCTPEPAQPTPGQATLPPGAQTSLPAARESAS